MRVRSESPGRRPVSGQRLRHPGMPRPIRVCLASPNTAANRGEQLSATAPARGLLARPHSAPSRRRTGVQASVLELPAGGAAVASASWCSSGRHSPCSVGWRRRPTGSRRDSAAHEQALRGQLLLNQSLVAGPAGLAPWRRGAPSWRLLHRGEEDCVGEGVAEQGRGADEACVGLCPSGNRFIEGRLHSSRPVLGRH